MLLATCSGDSRGGPASPAGDLSSHPPPRPLAPSTSLPALPALGSVPRHLLLPVEPAPLALFPPGLPTCRPPSGSPSRLPLAVLLGIEGPAAAPQSPRPPATLAASGPAPAAARRPGRPKRSSAGRRSAPPPRPGNAVLDLILLQFRSMVAHPLFRPHSPSPSPFWITPVDPLPKINLHYVKNALNFALSAAPDRFCVDPVAPFIFRSFAASPSIANFLVTSVPFRLCKVEFRLHATLDAAVRAAEKLRSSVDARAHLAVLLGETSGPSLNAGTARVDLVNHGADACNAVGHLPPLPFPAPSPRPPPSLSIHIFPPSLCPISAPSALTVAPPPPDPSSTLTPSSDGFSLAPCSIPAPSACLPCFPETPLTEDHGAAPSSPVPSACGSPMPRSPYKEALLSPPSPQQPARSPPFRAHKLKFSSSACFRCYSEFHQVKDCRNCLRCRECGGFGHRGRGCFLMLCAFPGPAPTRRDAAAPPRPTVTGPRPGGAGCLGGCARLRLAPPAACPASLRHTLVAPCSTPSLSLRRTVSQRRTSTTAPPGSTPSVAGGQLTLSASCRRRPWTGASALRMP